MSKNHIQPGKVIDFTNAGSAITSGSPVVIGNQIGVALGDIATGATGAVQMEEVFSVPKKAGAGEAIEQGTSPVFDVSAGEFVKQGTTASAGDVSGAVTAWADAADGDTSVLVKLNTGKGTVATGP